MLIAGSPHPRVVADRRRPPVAPTDDTNADFSERLPRWADIIEALDQDADRDAWSVLVRYILTATTTDPRILAARLKGRLPKRIQEEIMSTAESFAGRSRAEGLETGRAEGMRTALRKLLQLRFGHEPAKTVLARIEAADAATLERWTERVLTAPTAQAVVAD